VWDGVAEVRRNDGVYMAPVDKRFRFSFRRIGHSLYKNGGPIVSLQVEKEYGSFGEARDYMRAMCEIVRKHVGEDVVLFTTDGGWGDLVMRGSLAGLAPVTVDFGPGTDPAGPFAQGREYNGGKGPLVYFEYDAGWWGARSGRQPAATAVQGPPVRIALMGNLSYELTRRLRRNHVPGMPTRGFDDPVPFLVGDRKVMVHLTDYWKPGENMNRAVRAWYHCDVGLVCFSLHENGGDYDEAINEALMWRPGRIPFVLVGVRWRPDSALSAWGTAFDGPSEVRRLYQRGYRRGAYVEVSLDDSVSITGAVIAGLSQVPTIADAAAHRGPVR